MGIFNLSFGGFRVHTSMIYLTAFFINTEMDHINEPQDSVLSYLFMIGIPHEKSIRFHLSLQFRRAFSLTRKCHQKYIYEATKLCMRHENSDSKQSYRSKVTSAIDINGNAFTPPENLQLLHLKSKTFFFFFDK